VEEWEEGLGRDKGMREEIREWVMRIRADIVLSWLQHFYGGYQSCQWPTLHLYAQPKLQGWLERIGTMKWRSTCLGTKWF
jgi:hypothetical protein